MPLYSYVCEDGHEFEEIRSMAERNSALCPNCGKLSKLTPSPVSGRVIGGTPKFYPGRKSK